VPRRLEPFPGRDDGAVDVGKADGAEKSHRTLLAGSVQHFASFDEVILEDGRLAETDVGGGTERDLTLES